MTYLIVSPMSGNEAYLVVEFNPVPRGTPGTGRVVCTAANFGLALKLVKGLEA